MVLESIGAHGFIAFFGGILLILGFIKLSCGGIICCRKTKQQEYTQKMIDKGVPPKSERFYIMLQVLVNRDPMSPEQVLHCTSEHALSHNNKYGIIYVYFCVENHCMSNFGSLTLQYVLRRSSVGAMQW